MELRQEPRNFIPRPTTDCAQCGALILSSSWTEFVDHRRVRDVWECSACGYTFETEVVFPSVVS